MLSRMVITKIWFPYPKSRSANISFQQPDLGLYLDKFGLYLDKVGTGYPAMAGNLGALRNLSLHTMIDDHARLHASAPPGNSSNHYPGHTKYLAMSILYP